MQEYDEISESLDRLIEAVRLFVKKEEPLAEMASRIEKEIQLLSGLGKRLGGQMKEDVQALCEEGREFVHHSDDPKKESSLLEHCLILKNDLWEL
jgi:hypothetical protein